MTAPGAQSPSNSKGSLTRGKRASEAKPEQLVLPLELAPVSSLSGAGPVAVVPSGQPPRGTSSKRVPSVEGEVIVERGDDAVIGEIGLADGVLVRGLAEIEHLRRIGLQRERNR